MSIITAAKYGITEAAYQLYRNILETIDTTKKQVQVYTSFVTTNPVQMLIDTGIVIKPMRKDQAMKILNITGSRIDKAQLERNYKKYREQNVLSPFLQAKIDVAYSILK